MKSFIAILLCLMVSSVLYAKSTDLGIRKYPNNNKASGEKKPPVNSVEDMLPILHNHFDESFLSCMANCKGEIKKFDYIIEIVDKKLSAYPECECAKPTK